ncbi:hypothetical protein Avbf_14146 [Armadillidium vulgare]|nr:hypothetical protein Avbf_14146 [Armadillidium vulgare]
MRMRIFGSPLIYLYQCCNAASISFGSAFSEVSRYARVYRRVIGISGQKNFTYGFLSKIFKPGRPNYVHFSRIGFISAYLMFQTIGDKEEYMMQGITNEIQWTMFTMAEALNVAYIAYRNWTYEHDLEKPLAGLHLTTEQLFWTSFAQLMCSDHILQEGNRGTSKLYF